MPSRISHVKRFYGAGEGDARPWVDVERIDQLTRNSGQGSTFQVTVQKLRWDDEGEGNDSTNQTRDMHTLTVSNPNGPESVDILVIDHCTFSPRQDSNVTRKFRNRDDDDNSARETTSVRIESSSDTSDYVDVEIVDKFHDRDSDGRVIFKMRNQAYEQNSNGPGGPPSNPPYRLDPYQAIIGVSWGKKNHHDTPFSGYPRYILMRQGSPWFTPGTWVIVANALTLQIISWSMTIESWYFESPELGDTVANYIHGMVTTDRFVDNWAFLFDGGRNQDKLDAMNNAAADYSDGGGTGGATYGG